MTVNGNELKDSTEENKLKSRFDEFLSYLSLLKNPVIMLFVAVFRLIYPLFISIVTKGIPFISFQWMCKYFFYELSLDFLNMYITGLEINLPISPFLTIATACYIFLNAVYFSFYLYKKREIINTNIQIKAIFGLMFTIISLVASFKSYTDPSNLLLKLIPNISKIMTCIFLLFLTHDIEILSKKSK